MLRPSFVISACPRLGFQSFAALALWLACIAADCAVAPKAATGPRLRSKPFSITTEDRAWWSFQPVTRPTVPSAVPVSNTANPIDAFILARLKAQKLQLGSQAPRRELIRRAYFDLVGLPPSPEAVEAFERDRSPQAWERVVDDLLTRPQYGERWARHWLDVVRFAESNGYERDGTKPHAWRYRDYVIRSFNEDKPYSRFILEQLAGDELDEPFNADAIIATGFFRLHVWDDEPDTTLAAEFDDLDDIAVTTGAAFLGLTIGCARCHDHKFDPISQVDYYQLLSFIRNINPYGLHKTGGGGRGTGRITRPLAPAEQVKEWEAAKLEKLKPIREKLAAEKDAAERKKLNDEIARIEASAPFDFALAVSDDPLKPTRLFHRGDPGQPRQETHPLFPAVFGGSGVEIAPPAHGGSSGRRLALARWIARPENPLTARVMMNRLWQHHFGRGLVPTPNDFGRTGLKPSHPELLDWLADDFVAGGWKLKRMHKLILMSHAYRTTSHSSDATARARDEANDLFWRQNPRRMEAEVLRDSMLSISGALNPKSGGPGIYPLLADEVHGTQDRARKGWGESSPEEQNRRSIYIFAKRALVPPMLEAFDCPAASASVGTRAVTTVAPQALMLLNDPFARQQAERFALRLRREAGDDAASLVNRAFALTIQRQPSASEARAALALLNEQHRLAGGGENASAIALVNFCAAMFNLNEFLYAD